MRSEETEEINQWKDHLLTNIEKKKELHIRKRESNQFIFPISFVDVNALRHVSPI